MQKSNFLNSYWVAQESAQKIIVRPSDLSSIDYTALCVLLERS